MAKERNDEIMEHKELMSEIDTVITEELTHARAHFPNMASGHEGYAIILEEFEEMQAEVDTFKKVFNNLWMTLKSDRTGENFYIGLLQETAKAIIKEAVQVAAMCQRYEEDILKNE